ncbi:MAG TPA: hypothetical protein VMS65_11295 [Polyangiaceae bacterium]|nr:hypothetical protein [Polyangiaceae bacterium]
MRSRSATVLFTGAIWLAALCPEASELPVSLRFGPNSNTLWLQASALLATAAALLERLPGFGLLAAAGQFGLWALGLYLTESSFELVVAHLAFYGALLGFALLQARRFKTDAVAAPRSFAIQDAVIFVVTLGLTAFASRWAFGGFVFNGDEVASSYQANVYGHLEAYGRIPACASMFDNYWVFRHEGRAFSQYTPGWPLFMAPFQRLGIIWLAGPSMAALVAVGVARLSRRVVSGYGGTVDDARRIRALAGPIGAACAMLGPSMLLNGASRFSHTMVSACFAWAVESVCMIAEPGGSRRRAWAYGLLLGASTAFGVSSRPADGATLGIGVFLYFLWAFVRRRIHLRAFVATALAFAGITALTLVILRLQLGRWFHTGYWIAPRFHPEAELVLSLPDPRYLKLSIPLGTGAYCWWPAAPALALAGLLPALRGGERRVVIMLGVSVTVLMGFYSFVEFGRYAYDGLGPRYVLPVVVALAVGSAAVLAPLCARMGVTFRRQLALGARLRFALPGALAALAVVYGIVRLAPMIYPLARDENRAATAPLRAAKKLGLKKAIVALEPGNLPAHETNLAQNMPFDSDPDVLFLIRRTAEDEACARRTYPGRKWYRASVAELLVPY